MPRSANISSATSVPPSEARVARLVRAARLYYDENCSQQEIADRMNVSRASVSRMLTEARQEGMVTITISRPFDHLEDLESQLATEFSIKRAVVVPTSIDLDATLDVVGRAAAEFLTTVIKPSHVVGISWGRTVNRVVRAVEDPHVDGLSIVQMLGSLGAGDPAIDGHEIARRLGARLHAPYQYVSAPAVLESAADAQRLRDVRAVGSVLDAAQNVDISLFSIGNLNDPDTSLSRAGYLTDIERRRLLNRGGVGHVMAKVITQDGEELSSYNDRVLGVGLPSLRTHEWSICVATGLDKAPTMLGVLNGGYANCIVVDSALATSILWARRNYA